MFGCWEENGGGSVLTVEGQWRLPELLGVVLFPLYHRLFIFSPANAVYSSEFPPNAAESRPNQCCFANLHMNKVFLI